ncbi:unnamed protein product, partial [Heterosigma akashiwo]
LILLTHNNTPSRFLPVEVNKEDTTIITSAAANHHQQQQAAGDDVDLKITAGWVLASRSSSCNTHVDRSSSFPKEEEGEVDQQKVPTTTEAQQQGQLLLLSLQATFYGKFLAPY